MRSIKVSESRLPIRMNPALCVVALLPFILAACPNGACVDNGEPAEVQIGQGQLAFEPMADEIELFHGQQGGYHLDLALLLRNLNGEDLISGTLTATVGGELVGETSPWFDGTCTADGLEVVGTRVVFLDGTLPEDLVNQPVTIGAVVRDLSGNEGTGSVTTTIVDTVDENPETAEE